MNILIIGGGIAGLSTAFHLRNAHVPFEFFERESNAGGLASSSVKNGFTFDQTGQVLYLHNPYVRFLVERLLGKDLIHHHRNLLVDMDGSFIPYPIFLNLDSVPDQNFADLSKQGLRETLERRTTPELEDTSYEAWLRASFGDYLAEQFYIPYSNKLWKIPLRELSSSWAETFIPRPTLAEVEKIVQGQDFPYQDLRDDYYYPKHGMRSLSDAFVRALGSKWKPRKKTLVSLSLESKEAIFDDGERLSWSHLVTSIPLPSLLSLTADLPNEILEAGSKLRWTSVFDLAVGTRGKSSSSAHWIYYPSGSIIFHRVGILTNLSSFLAPADCQVLNLEITYTKSSAFNDETPSLALHQLREVGLVHSEEDVLALDGFNLPYGYPIYDAEYEKNRKLVLSYLKSKDVYSIGRYGGWKYAPIDSVIRDGAACSSILRQINC